MKCSLIVLFILSGSALYSQNLKDDKVLLSGKIGYHTANNDKISNSFTSGLLFDLSAEARVYNQIYLGINYQYWNNTDENFFIGNYGQPRDYVANSVGLFAKYRIGKRQLRAILGTGIGNFNITTTSLGSKNEENYLYIKAILGFEYKVTQNFMITLEGDYNSLLNPQQTANYFSFKIGPTVNINY